MLKKSETIQTDDGSTINIRELTVMDMDEVLGKIDDKRPPHWAEILFETQTPVEIVTASTGITGENMKKYTPTELHAIWEGVERVNDFLSRGLGRLQGLAERLGKLSKEELASEESSAG